MCYMFNLKLKLLLFAAEPVSQRYFGSVAIGGMDIAAYHLPQVQKEHKKVLDNHSLVEIKSIL